MRIVEQLEFNDKRIEKYTYVEIKTKDNSEYEGYLNFYNQNKYFGMGYWGYECVIELLNNLPKNEDNLEISHLHEHELNYTHSISVDIKEYEDKIRFVGNGIENITAIEVI